MNQWQVGKVKITRVVELQTTGGSRFILPDATPEACLPMTWMRPHFMSETGRLIMSVHALVVDTGQHRIVVDTCIGNDKQRDVPTWNNLQTPFLDDLSKAGYPREQVDTVLCTHLHVDHVGWNTMWVDGQWRPTFPNARYLFNSKEWQHWRSADEGESARIMGDSVRPIFDAGLATEVDERFQVCAEVSLEPTPGHTPGHVSVRIRSEQQQALITGDCIHHPCQIERIDWCSSADFDRAQALRTRRELLEQHADSDVLIIGTHFATPTAGHVRRGENGYWFEAYTG